MRHTAQKLWEIDALFSLLLFSNAVKNALIALSLIVLISSSALADENNLSKDDKANRIVTGIISFTHWPGLTDVPQLCVFTSARHISLPQNASSSFSVVYLTNETELATTRCDAIYFGDQSPQRQTQLLNQFQGKPLLSLAENNADCTRGAAFCLIFNADHTLFSVNLDSLARSGVKVSPDVLLLSRKGGQ